MNHLGDDYDDEDLWWNFSFQAPGNGDVEPVMALEELDSQPAPLPPPVLETSLQVKRENLLSDRKQRNRESAQRSREKQQGSLRELRIFIDSLRKSSAQVLSRCESCALENASLRTENERLFCQNARLQLKLLNMMLQTSVAQKGYSTAVARKRPRPV